MKKFLSLFLALSLLLGVCGVAAAEDNTFSVAIVRWTDGWGVDFTQTAFLKEIGEATGVNIEWQPYYNSTWSDQKSLMLASGKLTGIVTQNIDGLHQAAGSQNVLELHGSVKRNYCMQCRRFYPETAVADSTGVPRCACGGVIKPDVVLYEESLDEGVMTRALQLIADSDLLIVGGTSLTVYPAAGFITYRGGKLAVINKTPTAADAQADLCIHGSVGDALAAAWE